MAVLKTKYFIDCAPFVMEVAGNKKSLNIISYNLHGLNQGLPLLEDLLRSDNVDFCFVQEHWLSSDNLMKLDMINTAYGCVSFSAMDDRLSTDVLFGRPYGGVAFFLQTRIYACDQMFALF